MTLYIGQKFDPSIKGYTFTRWLIDGKYLYRWRSAGHRIVRKARPEDGSLPIKLNGERNWAVRTSLATFAQTNAEEIQETAKETMVMISSSAPADRVKRGRGRPRKSELR